MNKSQINQFEYDTLFITRGVEQGLYHFSFYERGLSL